MIDDFDCDEAAAAAVEEDYINDLRARVRELEAEVERLRRELISARG